MKLLKKAFFAILFSGALAMTFQCASPKEVIATQTFQKPATLKVKPVHFQEWYAGIKIGGTGINIFIPITYEGQNIQIENVYFRNLKGKLVKKNGKYVAVLKNKSKVYTFQKSEKPNDYPFTLNDNECAISYIENGQLKYFKITELNEVAGTYYENGPPSIYAHNSQSTLATTDEEADDEGEE